MQSELLIILAIVTGLALGLFIGWLFFRKTKIGPIESALNSKWETKLAESEKNYELKIERLKGENDKNLRDLQENWSTRYLNDLGDLKIRFQEAEKIIKKKSVAASRRTLVGKFIEKFVPFIKKFGFVPSDMQFLGQPIDYIVFEGLHEDNIKKIGFIEVKSGKSTLTKREKSLKNAIEKKNVYWKEVHIDTVEKEGIDKEIETKESQVTNIYEELDRKFAAVKALSVAAKKNDDRPEEEYIVNCPHCDEEVALDLDETDIDALKKGEEITFICDACGKKFDIDKSDVEDEETHLRGAAGERTYECPECGKEFSLNKKKLEILEKEGEVEGTCPHCKEEVLISKNDPSPH